VAFSCHVVVPDQQLSRIDTLSETIRRRLLQRFGIDHPVLQFETQACGEGSLLCELEPGNEPNGSSGPKARSGPSPTRTFFKKPLHFWIRLVLGVVFIIASADKIYNPGPFAQAIYNYQILPDVLINLMAIILPWLELFLGIFLIVGFWLPGAVTLANGLLIVFFGALVFNVARGLDVHCGCFSTSADGNPATAWYLIRDAAFLLMGGYLFFKVVLSRKPEAPAIETRRP
jgi:cobalt-zinc-cadmium efflux system protein